MLTHRTVPARVAATLLIVVISSLSVAIARQVAAAAAPLPRSHWGWCNAEALSATPAVVWARIKGATESHRGIPRRYWTDVTYRDDIAKIVCFESTWGYHAENGGQYGWFQMSSPLIATEGVQFQQYWGGSRKEGAGWYQCTAGERYIAARYGTPVVAWAHEENYGWY